MSDEKPFVVKRYDATVDVPGCECCGPSVDFREDERGDWVKIEDHNSAVTARERKAAAKALRALAASVRCATGVRDPKPSDPFWRDYFATMAETQAAALEGGAT